MPRPRIFASAAFKLALVFAATFALGATALVTLFNVAVAHYASGVTATALIDESRSLTADANRSRVSLAEVISTREQTRRTQRFLYALIDPAGTRRAGDLLIPAKRAGWDEVRVAEPGQADDPSDGLIVVRTYGVRVNDGGWLIVGTDTEDLSELAAWLRRVTLWSGIAITGLALGGGLLLASVFLKRLDRVNRSIQRIMEGRLEERMPQIGMGDEFDRLTDNLNRMLDRMQALMQGLKQVSTDIAHDLRTPLSRLRQHLETMREMTAMDQITPSIDSAVGQVDEVLITFQALLRIGQIEGGTGRARFEPVDLSETLERVGQAYETEAEDAGIDLKASIAPKIVVDGDPQLLAQLFSNLIENAFSHAGRGARVHLCLTRCAGSIVASVADTGPGIPAGERANVMGRFYRLDASRTTRGSGLGLALVEAIATLHGARIVLEDNQPGLRVFVRFPSEMQPALSATSL